MKRIWKLHDDARKNRFTRYQYAPWFIRFCAFKIWYCKEQHMYCFFPFDFANVIIFVDNLSGSYSKFVEADLEYPNVLHYNRSSWSELRYFDFEPSLKLWWYSWNSSDLRRVSGFFKVFKFWNFKNLSFFVRHHFDHYIRCELLLETYCKSLLVYQ